MKKRTALLFFIGLVLIFLLFGTVNLKKVEEKLFSRPLSQLLLYLFFIFIIQMVAILFSALKWKAILKDSNVSMRNLLPATFVGYLVNNITPVGIAGGEPIRAYILHKTEKVNMPTAASSVIVDLYLEIVPMLTLLFVSIVLILLKGIPIELAFIASALGFTLLVVLLVTLKLIGKQENSFSILLMISRVFRKFPLLNRYSEKIKKNAAEISSKFNSAMELQLMNLEIIIQGVLFSFFSWLFRVLRLYFVFLAIGAQISISTALIVETLVPVISCIPILPGALGIWEWSSVEIITLITTFLDKTPVTREDALIGTIMNRLFSYLLPSVFGLIFSVYLGINLSKLTRAQEYDALIKKEILRKRKMNF